MMTGWVPTTWDHLRVCGADRLASPFGNLVQGSPPRVRSRRCGAWPTGGACGITSACAEQTVGIMPAVRGERDHLRVCGADLREPVRQLGVLGSPPRVRSRRSAAPPTGRTDGITSACAEQTPSFRTSRWFRWDHLRVCGADAAGPEHGHDESGSPPRVRSRPLAVVLVVSPVGITSACAEQTPWASSSATRRRDHLRVCGADRLDVFYLLVGAGSPPRVRSRHGHEVRQDARRGITSACAEQTTSP